MATVIAKVGNLFDSSAQTLVNTVNTVGVMGKGIALGFKKTYPKMYADYKRRCDLGQVRIGEPYLYKVSKNRYVLNFPTKEHWRNVSKLADIEAGLRYLANHYLEWGITSLAVPPLGCGLGGLDWTVVGPTLHRYLRELDIPVELYAPHGTPPEQLGMDFLSGGALSPKEESTFIKERRLTAGAIAIASVVSYIQKHASYWPVGRVKLQKIAFFLTYQGIDTGLHFQRGSYGPFSPDLKKIVSRLVNNGVLVERHEGKTIAVAIGSTYMDARQVHKDQLRTWSKEIQEVGDLFLRLPTAEAAELAASAAYIAGEFSVRYSKKPSEFAIYREVLQWKSKRKPAVNNYKLAQTVRELNVNRWIDARLTKRLPVDDAHLADDC